MGAFEVVAIGDFNDIFEARSFLHAGQINVVFFMKLVLGDDEVLQMDKNDLTYSFFLAR